MSGKVVESVRNAGMRRSIVAVCTSLFSLAGIWWWRRRQQRLRVCALFLYPVKSCRAVSVTRATVTPQGFKGDRSFQISSMGRPCTPRDASNAKLYQLACRLSEKHLHLCMPSGAAFAVPLDAATTSVRVTCLGLSAAPRADNDRETLEDFGDGVAAWLEQNLSITGARLTGIGKDYSRHMILNPKHGEAVPEDSKDSLVSLADEAPFLLTSEASLADLNQRLVARGQAAINMDRFRANIVVSGPRLRPWEEDTWKRLRIGTVEFWVWQRCARCEMTTIDTGTMQKSKEPLATLATFRKQAHGALNFGMHLIPCSTSFEQATVELSKGSDVEVLEYHESRRRECKT